MGSNLHIANLSASVTAADLRKLFGTIGPVETATIITDAGTGRSQGSALVRMTHEADATAAISRLNFSQYDGLVMSVRYEPPFKGTPQ